MLQVLRPPIVGHFDLIRLLSDHRDLEFKAMEGVWERIERNLEFVASYGGILELNSSGLRKGLAEPYPCLPICQARHTASFPAFHIYTFSDSYRSASLAWVVVLP